ncbi:MAG: L-histidine N(alpha)-methyltransferase [Candidatus Pedobacter colombiensis]|uniref:L-histidine N(Alpha)-methyltransferase n=1 Tax=Candidatus Pedobacter colombiensis TaxID=3121371 RepID=A0AAJ5WAI5_9SPHI|nr:L-histidine N(alpha)-methyltransferase [Pedobacter sp.]WEK20934.1 MAG: L-histidine N(alpha)-methyltransferase [Pedobacter sp.]
MRPTTTENITTVESLFLTETLAGLQACPKFMHAKYFYDERGDYIFQQIMEMDEYYLTNAEMDIFSNQAVQIAELIKGNTPFDLIELGAGDATKSIHLLRALAKENLEFSYLPVDISAHVINDLEDHLPKELPELDIKGLNGDYLQMLQQGIALSNRRKVVLFMGANIGNMDKDEAEAFLGSLRNLLSEGDLLIIGFDLKKNPKQILAAYNDHKGITSAFNLNLLERINRELGGDFVVENFEHYVSYDPESGACKSYLISLKDQVVHIGTATIPFAKDEYVYMEISQKYALEDIERLASRCGFKPLHNFFDTNRYFVDAVWIV